MSADPEPPPKPTKGKREKIIDQSLSLLDMRDERMTVTLERDKDIILIPRDWWKVMTESLEPVDLGWW